MKTTRLISLSSIFLVCIFIYEAKCLSVQYPIRSDVIVTKWPQSSAPENHKPGWMVIVRRFNNLPYITFVFTETTAYKIW